jgi:hypothetical protein
LRMFSAACGPEVAERLLTTTESSTSRPNVLSDCGDGCPDSLNCDLGKGGRGRTTLPRVVQARQHDSTHTRRRTWNTSPEWEWDWYLRYTRPRLELLRRWGGHRAVDLQERLTAAEPENRRLDILVAI